MDECRIERFGRYEVLAELGRGAMGVVYKARDPKINRVVAVKTINLSGQPPEEEQEYRERFLREAEAAGRLSHPGIVTIFDVGEEPETRAPYIVMEFVGGQSLEKLLVTSPDHKLRLETALQLTTELAEALDCAHSLGVVHRDLKPANILITEEGNAKIADFGIAKLNFANYTLAGRALGTPAYMSPEQLNGENVDGRSDIFSLGVILYTIVTGYRPFQGNSAMTVSFKVVNRQPIPATILDTELPPGLDYIISRAMAKDPASRYQRGTDLAFDIQELRAGREPWNKTTPSDPVASTIPPMSQEVDPSILGQTSVPARYRPDAGQTPSIDHAAHARMLEKLRHSSMAGIVLLLGLLIVGLRIGSSLWPQPAALLSLSMPKTTPPAPAIEKEKRFAVDTAPRHLAKTSSATVNKRKQVLAAAIQPASARSAHSDEDQVASSPTPDVPAMLEIEVEHKFAEANLSIWVDDQLAFTHALEGTDKKRLVVFHHVQGHEFHAIQISPGKHQLRVQVTSDAANSPQSATVAGDFATGTEQMLHIQFGKSGEMNLSLQ
jgi:serine/threonine protein kinase